MCHITSLLGLPDALTFLDNSARSLQCLDYVRKCAYTLLNNVLTRLQSLPRPMHTRRDRKMTSKMKLRWFPTGVDRVANWSPGNASVTWRSNLPST